MKDKAVDNTAIDLMHTIVNNPIYAISRHYYKDIVTLDDITVAQINNKHNIGKYYIMHKILLIKVDELYDIDSGEICNIVYIPYAKKYYAIPSSIQLDEVNEKTSNIKYIDKIIKDYNDILYK